MMPGFLEAKIFLISSGNNIQCLSSSARYPKKEMSPLIQFTSCGSSSILVFLNNLPNLVYWPDLAKELVLSVFLCSVLNL